MAFLLQILAAIGIFVLYFVAYFATVRFMRRNLRRSMPEVERLPETLRDKLLAEFVLKDLGPEKEDATWGAKIRSQGRHATMSLAIIGLLALINKLGLPLIWTSIAVALVLGLPLIFLLCYLHQRPRIKRALRERMIQHGVLICPHCAANFQETMPTTCPTCRKTIDWRRLLKPPPEAAAPEAPELPARTPSKTRAALILLAILMILALSILGLVYMNSLIQETRNLTRDAWHEVALPANTSIEIEKAAILGFFLRSDSNATIADTQPSSQDAGRIRVRLLNAHTGEPLTLRTPVAAHDNKRWYMHGTEVRIVRVANIPAAGTYRLIVDGDPADGPLFWRSKQLAEKLILIGKMALPLVLLFAIIGVFKLRNYLRRRRNKSERPLAPSS